MEPSPALPTDEGTRKTSQAQTFDRLMWILTGITNNEFLAHHSAVVNVPVKKKPPSVDAG